MRYLAIVSCLALASPWVTAASKAGEQPALLVGEWINMGAKTDGLTRVVIAEKKGEWTVQVWQASGDALVPSEWPKVPLQVFGDSPKDATPRYGFASWDDGSAVVHATFRQVKGKLVVERFTLYKDKAEGKNYRGQDTFMPKK